MMPVTCCKAVADRIRHCVRESDFIARLGGDEFTIVLENIDSPESAANVAEKYVALWASLLSLCSKRCLSPPVLSLSSSDDGDDVSDLINMLILPCFVPRRGRNNFCFYEQGMEAEIAKRLRLEQELRKAIDEDELVLLSNRRSALSGKLVGAEALVRWQHPVKGLVSPDIFIPLAEESGLINQLSDWVLENSVVQLKRWIQEGHQLILAVNLSVKDLMAEGCTKLYA